mgnify:CR=1 FL=1
MLIIKPIEQKEEQKLLCEQAGVPFRKAAMAYAARVDGVVVGICQFTMNDTTGTLLDLAKMPGTDDEEAMFIMARQTLNFIDLCGVHSAEYLPPKAGETDEHLLRWIGFTMREGKWQMDLTGFFEEPCKHTQTPSDRS